MALVTVLSVMNGFERELQNNILGLMPQAILSAKQGSVNPQQLPEREAKLNGVTRVAPITTGDVVLQSARSVAVCRRANITLFSASSWRASWGLIAAIKFA